MKHSELRALLKEIIQEVRSEQLLTEYLTYDDLVSATKSYWNTRFSTVDDVVSRKPEMVMMKDGYVNLTFDYLSVPSTTGQRHKGYIQFIPKRGIMDKLKSWWGSLRDKLRKFRNLEVPPNVLKGSDLRKMDVKVSCDCPDFMYRFEVANNKKGASNITYSNGKDPNIRNPNKRPGICKHLLATLDYLTDDAEIEVKNMTELKNIIKEMIVEEIAYHKVDRRPIPDELYSIQAHKGQYEDWDTIKDLPTFELAKTELIRMKEHDNETPFRIVGAKTGKVYETSPTMVKENVYHADPPTFDADDSYEVYVNNGNNWNKIDDFPLYDKAKEVYEKIIKQRNQPTILKGAVSKKIYNKFKVK